MDIFSKVDKKKKSDKQKKKTKKSKNTQQPDENLHKNEDNSLDNGVKLDEGWNDEVEVEPEVRHKIKGTKLELKGFNKQSKTPTPTEENDENDESKGDWNNELKKEEAQNTTNTNDDDSKSTDDSNNKNKENTSSPEPTRSGGKFVPMHLRNRGSSGPAGPSASMTMGGGGGPRRPMRFKDPPKIESQSEFPTLGMAASDIKVPEGFRSVQAESNNRDRFSGSRGGGAGGNLETTNRFGKMNIE